MIILLCIFVIYAHTKHQEKPGMTFTVNRQGIKETSIVKQIMAIKKCTIRSRNYQIK